MKNSSIKPLPGSTTNIIIKLLAQVSLNPKAGNIELGFNGAKFNIGAALLLIVQCTSKQCDHSS